MNEVWNLDVIYRGFDDPAFAADMEKLEKLVKDYAAFAGELDRQTPLDGLKKGIALEEALTVLTAKLGEYASLRQSVNTRDAEAGSRLGQVMQRISGAAGAQAAWREWVSKIPDLMVLVAGDETLKDYTFLFERLLRNSTHLLGSLGEQISAKLSMSGSNAWSDLQGYLTSTVPVSYNGGTINLSAIRNLAYDPDPAVRKAAYEAERAAAAENLYTQGYGQYIQQTLEKAAAHSTRIRDGLFYSLCDLNGDGVMELLPGGKVSLWGILSMRDGKSYQYADFGNLAGLFRFTVCEDHVLELKDDDILKMRVYDYEVRYYFRAEADGLTYLEGLEREEGIWYSLPVLPPADPRAKERTEITEQQAQAIIASYVPLETQPERQQMKRYGEPVKPIPWTDPYAIYIAEALEWYEDSGKFAYTLMDLNGDGIQELIARDTWTTQAGSTEPVYVLSVHTIVDGELVIVQEPHGMTDVCEGGILMYREEDGTRYEFYRMKGMELELIEEIFKDRLQEYWWRVVGGENPQSSNCSEETARSYIAQYHPIELNMKPFSEYPFS